MSVTAVALVPLAEAAALNLAALMVVVPHPVVVATGLSVASLLLVEIVVNRNF